MITDELLHFIREHRANGVTDEMIKAILVENAWTPKDVDEAFHALAVDNPPKFVPPEQRSLTAIIAKVVILSASILFVFWLGVLVYHHVL